MTFYLPTWDEEVDAMEIDKVKSSDREFQVT